MKCRHRALSVRFPDGTTVLASSWHERAEDDPLPELGLYLDPIWSPSWPAEFIAWPDRGLPGDAAAARASVRRAFERARLGAKVEVGCIGGHGRTGTVLACMAVLAGVPPGEVVAWVRHHYCAAAVEGSAQEQWVEEYPLEVA